MTVGCATVAGTATAPQGYVDKWAGWGVDVRTSLNPKSNCENGTWMRDWDGDTPTHITPWVHSIVDDGAYLETNATCGAFRFTVDWRIAFDLCAAG